MVAGLVVSLGPTPWLSSFLYETRTDDPMTLVVVPLVLTTVAIFASVIPAHRASLE